MQHLLWRVYLSNFNVTGSGDVSNAAVEDWPNLKPEMPAAPGTRRKGVAL
jgi:hypothetical protein